MQNLSELARQSPNYPVWRKLRTYRDPDIYLAESVADYKQSAPLIQLPWYKRDHFPRAYIILHNVSITRLHYLMDWFIVQDCTGQDLMLWSPDHDLFPTLQSFDDVSEQQGLQEDDFVHEVFFRYLIKNDLSSIVEIQRVDFSQTKPQPWSIWEKVGRFFPDWEFLPQGS